jgi:xanthine dehydrogenase large subunit
MPSVGKDIPNDSAAGHVSGRSVFLDDVLAARNELLVGFAGSPVAHGRIRSVDTTAASSVAGVVALLTYRDIPGENAFGSIMKDEHLLAEETVEYIGDPVVLIVAENHTAMEAAKKAVRLEIEELPAIFSIDDAIAAGSFIGPLRTIARGDAAAALAQAEHRLQGSLITGGQEHFYFESQSAIAEPGESGCMTIHSSTQHPTETQEIAARILGVPFNHVVVVCKRMGGAFGGKETQAAAPAAMAALGAAITRRPCRFAWSKDDDMRYTGKRHPFQSRWSAGFDGSGLISAVSIELYANAGWACDVSPAILERAMLHSDNAYYIPNFRVTGRLCRTNMPSNTAFRGFGGPQGAINIENILEEIAIYLGKDALDLREMNCYGSGERSVTPYGQRVENNTLPRLFGQLRESSDYRQRQREIAGFNAANAGKVRGLSMTAIKFGISFTNTTLNQANALVNIYTDGSIMVSTGGTEMGQGLNTRLRQIVADELGVGFDDVIIAPTSTDKNNNTSPTSASCGTDLNGAAAVDACRALRERLAEFAAPLLGKTQTNSQSDNQTGVEPRPEQLCFEGGYVIDSLHPERRIAFRELAAMAYKERINLGERGFYATPGIQFDRETGKGTPFFYFTCGAAASEVEIDRFTGELTVRRVDALIDGGQCINPGIDRGQLSGGFMQGLGWATSEELKYSGAGELLTHSPTTYKIPNIGDLPEVFNLAFIENTKSSVSLLRSKALGEPPLLLAISVWTAAKKAVSFVSRTATSGLRLPASGETLLLAMEEPRSRNASAR